MMKAGTLLMVILIGGCSSVIDAVVPPPTPRAGDIQRSNDFRQALRALLDDRSVNGNAPEVSLDTSKLADWSAKSIAITKGVYGRRIRGESQPFGPPSDNFAFECVWAMDPPVWYSNYDPTNQRLRHDKNRLSLKGGTCTQFRKDNVEIRVGLFNFNEPFRIQVPTPERSARLARALQGVKFVPSGRQTDLDTWEVNNLLVGEAAGFLYEHVHVILHASYEQQTGSYYRLILVGDQIMACVDVFGPKRMAMQTLQAFIPPVIQALSFH